MSSSCDQAPFNAQMSQAVLITPKVTAGLGLITTSILLIHFFMMDKKKRNTYQRLIAVMSATNFWGCVAWFCGTWTYGAPSTCTWQGFTLYWIEMVSFHYNGALATNFFLRIHQEWTEAKMLRYEPYLHLACWAYPTTISFVGLGLGFYGIAGPWCFIPASGPNSWARWAFYGPLWAIIVYAILCMILIVHKIQVNDRRVAGSRLDGTNMKQRQKDVMYLAVLYIVAFVAVWAPGTINRIQQVVVPNCPNFALVWGQVLFNPLEGPFNFLIYFYKDFLKWMRKPLTEDEKQMSRSQRLRRSCRSFFRVFCWSVSGATSVQDTNASMNHNEKSPMSSPKSGTISDQKHVADDGSIQFKNGSVSDTAPANNDTALAVAASPDVGDIMSRQASTNGADEYLKGFD